MKVRSIALTLIMTAALHAQTPPDAVIRVEAREVVVDVTVSGKGTVPGSLTAKDFSLTEDGKAQKINSVSMAGADPDTAAKHFVLYFDYTTMSLRDQGASQLAAAEFVNTMASPDRYMAVVTMNSSGSRVVQGFTNSKALLQHAVAVPISGGAAVPAQIVPNLFDSLTAVAASLTPAPGRKTILYFTGGHPLTQGNPRIEKVTSALNRANIAMYVISSNRSVSDAGAAGAVGQMMGGRASQRGMTVAMQQTSADFATVLTEQTGGLLVDFTSNLSSQLAAAAREQDEYYRVSYTPPAAKEGTCHALKVAVSAKGLTAKARNEYCTEKPVDVVAGKIAGQVLEARAAGKNAGTLNATVQLPWVYAGPNRANVRLTAEAGPAVMKPGKPPGEIDVVGTLVRPDGGTAARFADTIDVGPDTFVREPWRYEHPFTVAAGTYVLRLAIGAGPNAVGTVEMPLTVEPWNPAAFGMAGIAFGIELRVVDANADAPVLESRAPWIVGGKQFVIAAGNRFAASGHLYFYTEIYEPTLANGAAPATLSAQVRVLDRKSGAVKIDTGAAGIGGYVRPGSTSVPFATAIPIAQLTPGSYRLEVSAMHSTGAEVVKREADFEVAQ